MPAEYATLGRRTALPAFVPGPVTVAAVKDDPVDNSKECQAVRLSPVRAAFAASFFATFVLVPLAVAQQPGAPLPGRPGPALPAAGPAATPAPVGTSVVVIDVAFVFKNHVRFNARMNEIKRDIEQYDAFVREETQKLTKKKEQLVQYNATSVEYKKLEEDMARMQSDLQIKVQLKRKEFLETEAKLYFDTYREIEQTVAVFAQRNRISLVLRFNGDEMKSDDRASVLQGVNRAVVYQQGLDITEHVLGLLNPPGQTAVAPGAQPPPAVPPTATRPIVPGGVAPQRPGIQR